MGQWYLGTIGFSYKDWVGEFYPKGTTQREYLPYYCKVFNSVELDTTFHSTPHQSTVQSWFANTPDDFKFCLKTPRAITHELGLKGTQGMMEDFIEALTPLGKKSGPILVQLPPSYSQDNLATFTGFLDGLPASQNYAIEFRHPSWYNEKTRLLLTKYRVCWVSIDYPRLPKQVNLTADFLYIRWIGVNNMYHIHAHERVDKSGSLKAWLKAITPHIEKVTSIYGYFNNDYAGFAAGTGRRFMQLAGLTTNEPDMPYQERLF